MQTDHDLLIHYSRRVSGDTGDICGITGARPAPALQPGATTEDKPTSQDGSEHVERNARVYQLSQRCR
ncbi:hypothetical protein EYF80_034834 [Liparis tanakae]|uniref:Uncharacterized protein n=1 Tax=Liparis tanakae TaxID=230148 RepID=A0A4Z2GN85_9TELE|nr:hypothetical protein EYF80_034834 [Liparis tanakae]